MLTETGGYTFPMFTTKVDSDSNHNHAYTREMFPECTGGNGDDSRPREGLSVPVDGPMPRLGHRAAND